MAFTGIGKLIKNLVTGTPADTDYFAFGNTDLKKVSFPNLKKALGINALNSALDDKQGLLMAGSYSGDIDNAKDTGCYWCSFSDISGAPYTSGFGWLEVMKSSDTSFVQKIYRFYNGITQITVRCYANSKWYPWKAINISEIS